MNLGKKNGDKIGGKEEELTGRIRTGSSRRVGRVSNNADKDPHGKSSSHVHTDYNELFRRRYRKLKKIISDALCSDVNKAELSLFQIQFKECFLAWKEIDAMRDEENRANIILESFYSREKIKSEFQDFMEYVEEDMESEENVEDLIVAGFNSYMNFARIDYLKMKKRLNEISSDCEKEKKRAKKEDEELIDFLQMLAYKNDFFSDIYTAYCKGLKRINGETMMESDKELFSLLKKVLASIENYGQKDSPPFFADVIESMKQQKEKTEATISEAESLKSDLDKIMCDQNIEALQNRDTDLESLKKQYSEIGQSISDLLAQLNQKIPR